MAESTHKAEVVARAEALVEPLVRAEGFELIDLQYAREPQGWVVRLFIDRPGHDPMSREGGVGLDECAAVSHAVETALEVEDLVPHAYSLEVSSPGLERPLRTAAHFARAVGEAISVKARGVRVRGVVQAVGDDTFTLLTDAGEEHTISYAEVVQARTVFEWGGSPKQAAKKQAAKQAEKSAPKQRAKGRKKETVRR